MARLAPIAVPQVPHHVTSRGNRRLPLSLGDDDRRASLALVARLRARPRTARPKPTRRRGSFMMAMHWEHDGSNNLPCACLARPCVGVHGPRLHGPGVDAPLVRHEDSGIEARTGRPLAPADWNADAERAINRKRAPAKRGPKPKRGRGGGD
jgi:hypothetical protein